MKDSYILDYPNRPTTLFVKECINEEMIQAAEQRDVKGIVISHYKGMEIDIPEHLKSKITTLWIDDSDTPLSFCSLFRSVKDLKLSNASSEYDLSLFTELAVLRLEGYKKMPQSLAKCSRLTSLTVGDSCVLKSLDFVASLENLEKLVFSASRLIDLKPISSLKMLRYVGLGRGKFTDLDFLSGCKSLESLYIEYSSLLEDISALSGLSNLKEVQFANCKSLRNIEPLSCLSGCRRILLESCPNIASVRPLAKMPALVDLDLWEGTSIEDGDLLCMLETPLLESLQFKNRKHYNLKSADAKERLG